MPILKREVEWDLFLRKWQGSLEQTDDMLFMGICPQTVNSKYEKTVNQELAYKSANQPYFFLKCPNISF